MKQSAERAKTLKADFKTNVSHSRFVGNQQFLGTFNSSRDQILVRGLIKCLTKQSEKVITRKTRATGDLFEIERPVITEIDKVSRARETLKNIRRGEWRLRGLYSFGHNGYELFSFLNGVCGRRFPEFDAISFWILDPAKSAVLVFLSSLVYFHTFRAQLFD